MTGIVVAFALCCPARQNGKASMGCGLTIPKVRRLMVKATPSRCSPLADMEMNNANASGQPMKLRLLFLVLAALALVGFGYLSAILSLTTCASRVARTIAAGPMQGKTFYVAHEDWPSVEVFRRIGADVIPFTTLPRANGFKRVTWPEGDAVPDVDNGGSAARVSPGRCTIPFVVAVDHAFAYAALGGGVATTYFFCIFGIPIRITTVTHAVS